MSKRFTATEKWDDSWFCSLAPLDKLFWFYLTDRCDSAGIWDVNEPLVKFHLGADFKMDPERFTGRVVIVAPGKWFIPAFIRFQYGELKVGCRPHDHVLAVIKKHNLKGYLKGMDTLKDKTGQGQGQDKDQPPAGNADGFDQFWSIYPKKVGKEASRKIWKRLKPDRNLQGRIINAVRAQVSCDQWLREGGQFIPHPATWLHAGRWQDEIAVALPEPPKPSLCLSCSMGSVRPAGMVGPRDCEKCERAIGVNL